MLTTDQKGNIAETAIIHAAVKRGIGVLKPMAGNERYDLVFDLGPTFMRVQCKWAVRHNGVIIVRCYSVRRTRDGVISRPYLRDEVDAVAAYDLAEDRCYLLPPELFAGHREVWLRLAPTRNNQKLRINWADDFDFARLDWESIKGP